LSIDAVSAVKWKRDSILILKSKNRKSTATGALVVLSLDHIMSYPQRGRRIVLKIDHIITSTMVGMMVMVAMAVMVVVVWRLTEMTKKSGGVTDRVVG
jgi:hypothetical protein